MLFIFELALNTAIHHRSETSETNLLKKHPLSVQGFWAGKKNVEQQFDAALIFPDTKCTKPEGYNGN